MATANIPDLTPLNSEEHWPQHKLDLSYFTAADRCPLMVRRRARGAFELFLYLAYRFIHGGGEPVVAEHEELCAACGVVPDSLHSSSEISRLLRSLRETYQVIDYRPVQRRQPRIRLAAAKPGADILNPHHYIYFNEGWSGTRRAIFDVLGNRAFCAEYMYLVGKYESALAQVKHGRSYWFFPLESISAVYHISTRFSGAGLRGLVRLGVMQVVPGQFSITAPGDQFGKANRYYFQGLGEVTDRKRRIEEVQDEHPRQFATADELSRKLINGATTKNVAGLCELMVMYGEEPVRAAVKHVANLSPRSLKRRLAYVKSMLARSQATEPG
ncbi:MAG: hypothetical protein NTY19_50650 [Planctomycetota bacterium]|nr:hypothetical protein [Planctomycetota bacterium]